ncbi:uncharacterized protein LOC8075142 [Sorghum bicolor]|uniref:uncharacterized protein LOC8075142 n=1 Tax=Sorghum bicolor TaxID=4558 RepID=UPI000B4238D8|nr:uncharacterized protein LOC8075142 [Sorghum bicolor]|eukprot:XP_021311746.1 uncharacterized protein LOC8075142 [Sorghum bicolor]
MAAAAAATTAHARHHLKLVIDTNSRRVLFAEANGEAIEFLYSLLVSPHVSLPFDGATWNACIGNVYESVDKLRAFAAAANIGNGNGNGAGSCGCYVADKSGARCPSCGGEMAVEVPRGDPGASCSDPYDAGAADWPGGMKGADLTCMLMDDLNVMPAGSGLSLATSFMMGFVAPGVLQETVVCLGYTEAMEILEMSLQSRTVLTDVFLCKKSRRFGKSPQ